MASSQFLYSAGDAGSSEDLPPLLFGYYSSLDSTPSITGLTAPPAPSIGTAVPAAVAVPAVPAAASSPLDGRLARRGHTKSRQGCFNCKRRRIKCQETRPACGHCVKTGLACAYPQGPPVRVHPPPSALAHQTPLFSLQDMRLFQHFLQHCSARPHQPLGNETLWAHEIPCLAHTHDYLMHALLGLAASDLLPRDPRLVAAAMDHRLKAIRAIQRTLAAVPRMPNEGLRCPASSRSASASSTTPTSTPTTTTDTTDTTDAADTADTTDGAWVHGGSRAPGAPMFEEGNALMATCFALTFQSAALDDGVAEYMTFIRGILLVAVQMYRKGARILFRNLLNNEQAALVRPVLAPLRPDDVVPRAAAEAARAAVRRLAPLCAADPVAATHHALVAAMADALLVSPMEAYVAMTRHYGWWMQLPHEQFRQVIDLDRPVFVLLATHWIALKQIMQRITDRADRAGRADPDSEDDRQPDGGMDPGLVRWLRYLNRRVDPAHRAYNAWPEWVEAQLDRDRDVFGRELEAGEGGDEQGKEKEAAEAA